MNIFNDKKIEELEKRIEKLEKMVMPETRHNLRAEKLLSEGSKLIYSGAGFFDKRDRGQKAYFGMFPEEVK